MSDPVVVLQSFVGNLDGADIKFLAGDLFAADHQAAKKWPHLFGPSQSPIEQATAAPGEKRAGPLRRRAAKAPKATAAQEAGIAASVKAEAADAAMPEPKPIPEPEPEKAPAGKAMTTASFEGK